MHVPVVQGSSKRRSPGLMNFVPAVAYHPCLILPAAFTQPGDHLLAEPCSANIGFAPALVFSSFSIKEPMASAPVNALFIHPSSTCYSPCPASPFSERNVSRALPLSPSLSKFHSYLFNFLSFFHLSLFLLGAGLKIQSFIGQATLPVYVASIQLMG